MNETTKQDAVVTEQHVRIAAIIGITIITAAAFWVIGKRA